MAMTDARSNRSRRERRIVAAVIGVLVLGAGAVYAWAFGSAAVAYWNYAPQEGDIVFQSLPHSPLVDAIEGATHSPLSHCGIVSNQQGRWVVYEAFDGVEAVPLRDFIYRGRGGALAVYRLDEAHRRHIPATIKHVQSYVGLPYDARYRMDDEAIYCTELIYKAYRDASGGDRLGTLIRLGELDWRPYERTITQLEGGPAPLDREMITPHALARAAQLQSVYVHRLDAPTRSAPEP